MKIRLISLFPSKSQWKNWSLPSKATYISLILGTLALIISVFQLTVPNKITSIIEQPQIAIIYTAKPYLRYSRSTSGLELSYEICFTNTGKHPAINLKYQKFNQKLIIKGDTINTNNNISKKPPEKLVANEKYCQIFELSNTKMTNDEISKILSQFELNNVSIFLELNLLFEDDFTGKKYSILERNNIKPDRVEIY